MSELLNQLERLTGRESKLRNTFDNDVDVVTFERGNIGASQMKELLLTAGFDLISTDFFMLLKSGKPTKYKDYTQIKRIEGLTKNVEQVRKLAALKYGNFKFAFNKWSRMSYDELEKELEEIRPPHRSKYFETRTAPLENIKEIRLEDTYLLGHISGNNPNVSLGKKEEVRQKGKENLRRYLTFDHMDVYVATSMRKLKDYLSAGRFIRAVFGHKRIKPLRLRYFDPTQAYSEDRFCKGLAESLMLKRARCCIYCVQENDTLGKDSELAVTLAQGKPVIAYVPKIENIDEYARQLLNDSKLENDDSPIKVLREYYVSTFPDEVLNNIDFLNNATEQELARRISELAKDKFELRACQLLDTHPLALQVAINTGVAHGVLVVRTVKECAELLYQVLYNKLEFNFEEISPNEMDYSAGEKTYVLREKITNSPYRVVISDQLLSNSFWNYYLLKT